MARPEDNVVAVVVSSSMDIKAMTSVVSEVSGGSLEVEQALGGVVNHVLSDDCVFIECLELSELV